MVEVITVEDEAVIMEVEVVVAIMEEDEVAIMEDEAVASKCFIHIFIRADFCFLKLGAVQ